MTHVPGDCTNTFGTLDNTRRKRPEVEGCTGGYRRDKRGQKHCARTLEQPELLTAVAISPEILEPEATPAFTRRVGVPDSRAAAGISSASTDSAAIIFTVAAAGGADGFCPSKATGGRLVEGKIQHGWSPILVSRWREARM